MPAGRTAARPDARADRLDLLAMRLQDVADEMRRRPGRPHGLTEQLISEVEEISTMARKVVRG